MVLCLKGSFGGDNTSTSTHDIAIMAVADGVGGGPAGEIAGKASIEFFLRSFIGSITSFSETRAKRPISELIKESFQFAHTEVSRLAVQNPEYLGMASTLTVAVLVDSSCFVGNVGDSRCYLIRDGRVKQLSTDHNAAGSKNMLSQAIGVMHSISVSSYELSLKNNDVLLLCSDGLSNYVGEQKIAGIVNSTLQDLQLACSKLIDAANQIGGADNISVALGKISLEIY